MSIAVDWVSISTVVAAGIVTLLARASFIVMPSEIRVPAWFTRALKFVGAAVLPALILPDVLFRELAVGESVNHARIVAAFIAAMVAWRTKNIFATLAAGMLALWALQWVLGKI